MSLLPQKRSWFSRLNPFARRAEQTTSRRPAASRPSFRPSLEALEDRRLLSTTPVGNTTEFPDSAVVRIFITFPDGSTAQGTGTMVNPNTVLTAGHVVYDASDGGWATSIEVIPGQNGNSQPYGIAYSVAASTFTSYIAASQIAANQSGSDAHVPGDGDIGFISLNRDVGDQTGWLSLIPGITGTSFDLSKYGYPSTDGYNGTQLVADYGSLIMNGVGSAPGFGYLGWSSSSMSSIPGESGSSLVLNLGGGRNGIIAVQDVGNSSEGYAETITQSVVNSLWAFEQEHPTNAGSVVLTNSLQPPQTSPSSPAVTLQDMFVACPHFMYQAL